MRKKYFLSLMSMVFLLSTLLLPTAEARDPLFPSCNGININDTYATITTQVSSNKTFAWGVTPTAALVAQIGSSITGSMTYASIVKPNLTVRQLYPGSLYSPHTMIQPYTYHGSFLSYQYVGSTQSAQLESQDVLTVKWKLQGNGSHSGEYTEYTLECKVP